MDNEADAQAGWEWVCLLGWMDSEVHKTVGIFMDFWYFLVVPYFFLKTKIDLYNIYIDILYTYIYVIYIYRCYIYTHIDHLNIHKHTRDVDEVGYDII